MRNIELKIDGEVIVLTSQQTEQLKRAIIKETSVLAPKMCGNLLLSSKESKSTYPFVISSSHSAPSAWGIRTGHYGKDFSLAELKTFITNVKAYAAQIWTTAEKELKNV